MPHGCGKQEHPMAAYYPRIPASLAAAFADAIVDRSDCFGPAEAIRIEIANDDEMLDTYRRKCAAKGDDIGWEAAENALEECATVTRPCHGCRWQVAGLILADLIRAHTDEDVDFGERDAFDE